MTHQCSFSIVSWVFSAAFAAAMVGAFVEARANGVPERVTYSRDVAPILFENCASCHRPGEIAPMSLHTYDEVRPWAKAIREKVAEVMMQGCRAGRGTVTSVRGSTDSTHEKLWG